MDYEIITKQDGSKVAQTAPVPVAKQKLKRRIDSLKATKEILKNQLVVVQSNIDKAQAALDVITV